MKTNLSPNRFYLSNIIFYTCLLAFPLSAAVEPVSQPENSKPSIIGNENEWMEVTKTESSDEESSPKLTRDKKINMLNREVEKKDNQLKGREQIIADFQSIILIEARDEKEKTSFLYAAEQGKLDIGKLLRKWDANINARDKDENNALHLACLYSGNVAMVTWLLDVCKIGLESKGHAKKTPFLCAAEQGQLEIAKLLKQHGANIHAKDKYGNNALHLACLFSGSVAMVTWLLNACRIGLESKGEYQKTPFFCAAQKGQLGIAKLLKDQGANIYADRWGDNALHFACYSSGSVAMVTWLLDKCKLDIEAKGLSQKTPFLCTAEKGQLEIAKLLKERGANIHAKGYYGRNALHLACLYSSSVAMVTWLLDVCHIDIETKGFLKKTPFLSAVIQGQLGIAKLLKNRGANIHARDEDEDNALHLACKYSGSEEMITWLSDVCEPKKVTWLNWFTG